MSDTNKSGAGKTPNPEGETYDESGATIEESNEAPAQAPYKDVPPDRRPAEG